MKIASPKKPAKIQHGERVVYRDPRWKNGDLYGTVVGQYGTDRLFIKTDAGHQWALLTEHLHPVD